MKKFMEALVEKLYAAKEKEASVRNDYMALLKAVSGCTDDLDDQLNDNVELAEEVTRVLSTLKTLYRYCMEERFLHGRSIEQLTEDFRAGMDIGEFTDAMIETLPEVLCKLVKDDVDWIFWNMEKNSFRELKDPREEQPKSIVNIVRESIDMLDECGLWYKDIFQRYFLQGETKEELVRWISENLQDYVKNTCASALRVMRHPTRTKRLSAIIKNDHRS